MTTEEAVATLIETLNKLEVPYMLVGSYSSNFYGLARSTKDADVVVNLPNDVSIGAIARKLGPAFQLNPHGGFETVTATSKYVVTLVIFHSPSKFSCSAATSTINSAFSAAGKCKCRDARRTFPLPRM